MSWFYEEFKSFTQDLKDESDRAVVVIGAAKLDLMLKQLLETFLIPSSTGRDELLDDDQAVGTFNARINLTYRVGLITDDFARALHIVRRIRNSFAHEYFTASLSTGAQRDRVFSLVSECEKSPTFIDFCRRQFTNKATTPSEDFKAILALMHARLHGAIEVCNQLQFDVPTSFIPPGTITDKEEREEG